MQMAGVKRAGLETGNRRDELDADDRGAGLESGNRDEGLEDVSRSAGLEACCWSVAKVQD